MILIGLVIFLLTSAIAIPAYSFDIYDPMKKLARGGCNMLTFPLELYYQFKEVNTYDGPVAAATWGLAKGFFMSGVRLVVGAYEIVTFPIPIPKDYEPILTDPEFMLSRGG